MVDDTAQRLTRFEHVNRLFGPALGATDGLRLNLGCGRSPIATFVNIDRVGGHGAEKVIDLEYAGFLTEEAGFAENSVDCVLASHVLEHIRNLIPLMRWIHGVLKPGGRLIAITPYASSDDADEDPTHVRRFTENSWAYFDERLYAGQGHAGCYPSEVDFSFDVEHVELVPFPDIVALLKGNPIVGDGRTQFDTIKRFQRNTIREMQAILRKPAAVDNGR